MLCFVLLPGQSPKISFHWYVLYTGTEPSAGANLVLILRLSTARLLGDLNHRVGTGEGRVNPDCGGSVAISIGDVNLESSEF